MSRKEEFEKDQKACPQCGASMIKMDNTTRTKVSEKPRKGGGVSIQYKYGPKKTRWYCNESFEHTVDE